MTQHKHFNKSPFGWSMVAGICIKIYVQRALRVKTAEKPHTREKIVLRHLTLVHFNRTIGQPRLNCNSLLQFYVAVRITAVWA